MRRKTKTTNGNHAAQNLPTYERRNSGALRRIPSQKALPSGAIPAQSGADNPGQERNCARRSATP